MKTNNIGQILALTSEGQGILRHENLVIFIPFTAPGDIIRFEITSQKKNFAQGQLVEILQSSPDRTQPLCRYYGECGGCQLQHLTYQAQLKGKQQIIHDALTRIGKFSAIEVLPVIAAQINWAYRRHVTMKITPKGAGYVAVDNQTILDIQHCPIFIPENSTIIQEIQSLVRQLSTEGSIVLFKAGNDQWICTLYCEQLQDFQSKIFEQFLSRHPHWKGITLHYGRKKQVWGDCTAFLEVEGLKCLCSPEVFTQNHPEQSLKIYQHLTKLLSSHHHMRILDLYCGIGISSLLLAKQGHQVIGVEYNPLSIEMAQENARNNDLPSEFIQGDVEKILQKQLKNEQADVIVINPPRIGITPRVIEEILRRRPQQIIYISCMPSTLARDLALLCAKDYRIALIQPYDMFPQTSHVETVVQLDRMD